MTDSFYKGGFYKVGTKSQNTWHLYNNDNTNVIEFIKKTSNSKPRIY